MRRVSPVERVDRLQSQVQLSHDITISGKGGAQEAHGDTLRNGRGGSQGSDLFSCFSSKVGISPRSVRVARSKLTKKHVVGAEKVGERGRWNGIDGDPFRSFSLLLLAEISK